MIEGMEMYPMQGPCAGNRRLEQGGSGSRLALGLLSAGAVLAAIPGIAQAGPPDDRRPSFGVSRIEHEYSNQRYGEWARYRLPPGAYYVPPSLVVQQMPPAYYAPSPAIAASPPVAGAVMPLTIR